jgi:ketosteroid isomerase-like protein
MPSIGRLTLLHVQIYATNLGIRRFNSMGRKLIALNKYYPLRRIEMQRREIALASILILTAVVSSAHAQSRTRHVVRRELEAKYAKVVEAYRNKDIKAFMENKTPDFTGKSLNGSIATREQVEAGVKQHMERIKKLNYLKIEIKNITVIGDVAVAITTQAFSRVVSDAQGQEHTVVSKGTTHRDTWVKTENGWMLKSVEELKQGKEYVDGQAMTP